MSNYDLMTYDEWEELHAARIHARRKAVQKLALQKMMGAALCLIGVAAFFIDGGAGATVICCALGAVIIFSKGDLFHVSDDDEE